MPNSSVLIPVERLTTRQMLVSQIQKAIFRGEFEGVDRLREQDLSKRFGVSRTPIREAMLELQFFGFIKFESYKGATINQFGPKELRELFHIRGILEAESTRLSCRHILKSEIDELTKKSQLLLESEADNEGWPRRHIDIDRKFHELMANRCGVLRLKNEINRHLSLIQTVRESVQEHVKYQKKRIQDHLEVLDLINRADAEGAGQRMREHVEKSAKGAVAVLFPLSKG